MSVDQRLAKQDFMKLICEIIKTENPRGFSRLTIGFYYKLDRYEEEAGDEVVIAKHRKHSLGVYFWSDSMGGILHVFSKEPGTQNDGFEVDHRKFCNEEVNKRSSIYY